MKKTILFLIGIICMIIFTSCQQPENDDNTSLEAPASSESPSEAEPVNPVNLADLKNYIDNLGENTIDKPYVITVVNADSTLFSVLASIFKYKKINKFISLDLSKCEFDSIPSYAFYGSKMLVEIVLPKRAITINQQAFCETNIKKVVNSEYIVALIGCPFLDTTIEYLDLSGLQKMNDAAFLRDYNNLIVNIDSSNKFFKTLYEGKAIVSKDETVFYELLDNNMKELILPETYQEIGEDACAYRQLEKVVLPESLKKLGRYSLSHNSRLTSVNIPNSITVIEPGTFHSCSSLTTVKLPNTITKISGYAFTSCSSLTSFTIPASVKYIGSYNFYAANKISGKINFEVTTGWKKKNTDEPVSADYLKNFVNNYEYDIYRD